MQGICFIEPLFHKVVKREKRQTRRVIPVPKWAYALEMGSCGIFAYDANENADAMRTQYLKPKYKLDEVVYLKEPYKLIYRRGFWLVEYMFGGGRAFVPDSALIPDSDGITKLEKLLLQQEKSKSGWLNKLFMPEWAAGHFIKIKAVRPERLQDISEEDCMKEGIEKNVFKGKVLNIPEYFNGYETFDAPIEAYVRLIDQINGEETWGSNPFVWVYDFELHQS